MKKILLPLFLSFSVVIVFATGPSQKRTCATMDVLAHLKAQDPSLELRMKQIDTQAEDYVRNNKYSNQNNAQTVITIPVVFHILYSTSAQNISDAQCKAQIDQLNQDFARSNSDRANTPSAFASLGANTGIQFCLATTDPNGKLTTGIERRPSKKSFFTMSDAMKYYSKGGLDAWPSESYLNIWSCNLGQSLLGYAQFPGGPKATDGIVILYSSVGSIAKPGTEKNYNQGRTATHEVGHWVNLYHIWGDDGGCSGSDKVNDTPNQGAENYGCPTFPLTDACSSTSPGVMFMNYMDYTYDNCMNIFTAGQSQRMNALFASGGARASLLSSKGCLTPKAIHANGNSTALRENEFASNKSIVAGLNEVTVYPNPSHGEVFVNFNASAGGILTARITDMIGKEIASKKIFYSQGDNRSAFDLTNFEKGIYFVELTTDSQRIIQKLILDK